MVTGARSVLITGHRGLVGRVLARRLAGLGWVVHGFDVAEGDDVLDKEAVMRAVDGRDAVVHLAALFGPRPGETDPAAARAIEGMDAAEAIIEVNAMGGQHVLEACLVWGVSRLVNVSSVNALGVFTGESLPDYLPIDDLHPARPQSAYGMSKRAVERVAGVMSKEGGLTTISLRPPGVLDDASVGELRAQRQAEPSSEWLPVWEYGAWIHVEDLVDAVVAALDCPTPPGGSATVLLAAGDVCSDLLPACDQVRRWAPGVEWRGGAEYDEDPWRSLIDTSRARVLLGWEPTRTWPRRSSVSSP